VTHNAESVAVPRYERLGAQGDEGGIYVRFDPGFGLNVYIGHRSAIYKGYNSYPSSYEDRDGIGMSILGWEHLCRLVDEWRARQAEHFDGLEAVNDES